MTTILEIGSHQAPPCTMQTINKILTDTIAPALYQAINDFFKEDIIEEEPTRSTFTFSLYISPLDIGSIRAFLKDAMAPLVLCVLEEEGFVGKSSRIALYIFYVGLDIPFRGHVTPGMDLHKIIQRCENDHPFPLLTATYATYCRLDSFYEKEGYSFAFCPLKIVRKLAITPSEHFGILLILSEPTKNRIVI